MKVITTLTTISLFCLLPQLTKAAHVIGGTMSYSVTEVTTTTATVKVNLFLYRNKNIGASFDNPATIGVYSFQNDEYEYILSTANNTLEVKDIPLENGVQCPGDLVNYSVGEYSFDIILPLTPEIEFYKIAYQRCCRDYNILNITNSNESGIAIALDIYPKAFEIDSPIVPLSTNFPALVSPGKLATYDFSVEDNFYKEYYLSAPKTAGGILGVNSGDPSDCEGIIPNPQMCLPDFEDVEYQNPNYPYGEGAIVTLGINNGVMDINIPQSGKILVGVSLDRYQDEELFCRVYQQFIVISFDCSISNTKEMGSPNLEIWPIPAQDILNFSIPLRQINISDIHGMQPIKKQNNEYSSQWDISHLSSGIYFLHALTLENVWVTKKFVKL